MMTEQLNFKKLQGLVPAVIQDAGTSRILMVGFMNHEAVERTEQDGLVTFWSRTRNTLWRKGETSGNTLSVISISKDCDSDALLVKVRPAGPVCHTGAESCFGESESEEEDGSMLKRLEAVISERARTQPDSSYTARLLREGTGRIAQKVGEEAAETIVAAMQRDRNALKQETADLLYHLLVLLKDQEIGIDEIGTVLRDRMKG